MAAAAENTAPAVPPLVRSPQSCSTCGGAEGSPRSGACRHLGCIWCSKESAAGDILPGRQRSGRPAAQHKTQLQRKLTRHSARLWWKSTAKPAGSDQLLHTSRLAASSIHRSPAPCRSSGTARRSGRGPSGSSLQRRRWAAGSKSAARGMCGCVWGRPARRVVSSQAWCKGRPRPCPGGPVQQRHGRGWPVRWEAVCRHEGWHMHARHSQPPHCTWGQQLAKAAAAWFRQADTLLPAPLHQQGGHALQAAAI